MISSHNASYNAYNESTLAKLLRRNPVNQNAVYMYYSKEMCRLNIKNKLESLEEKKRIRSQLSPSVYRQYYERNAAYSLPRKRNIE